MTKKTKNTKKVTRKTTKKTTRRPAKVRVAKPRSTHVAVLLDRSGSMMSIKGDIIGGYNTFVEEQRKSGQDVTLALVQFDSGNPYDVVHDAMPVKLVPALTAETFNPRGSTPLLDAMGQCIQRVRAMTESASRRPNVVIVVVTDGQENSSHEFNKSQIQAMISERQAAGWQFVFLSADLNSIGDAHAYGISRVSTMAYDANGAGAKNMFASLSVGVSNYTKGCTRGVQFTDADRAKQKAEAKTQK